MAAPQTPLLASVLLLAFLVLHSSSSLPPCPQSCFCKSTPLLNCSSSGLSVVPRLLQDSVTELDLSHNLLSSLVLHQPHPNLRNVWLGNNSITYLSLCIERHLKDPRLRRRLRTQSRIGCQVWGPALQLLSAERNLLEQLPEGLGGVRSLKVLQLSFNRISTLKPEVLSHLRQLKELYLQHNLITHLYPQTFQDLDQLRVLDLRFNMLTSLHPLMYLTLRTIGTDVQLEGNRWQCNCIMRNLQRRMAYDSSRGLQAWSIVCTFPSRVLGRDLLQLQEEDFDCLGTENRQDLHQDVTVYSGSEILLSCSAQDSMLWTPSGKGSISQQNTGLLISDVSDSNTGLYVCVSEENQVVSVFNLQISKTGGARKARSLPISHNSSPPQNTVNGAREVKESDLALAVCLSIFITFLLAFILGVLARPLIDMLCKRIAKKKSPSATHTVSSREQRPYDNEAFSDGEEQEDPGPFRERRVTFSTVDFIEDSNVQRYNTEASGDQESISSDAVIECEGGEAEPYDQTAGDSGSEHLCHNSSENKQSRDKGSGDSNEKSIHNKEFEQIPDPFELEKRSLSSCSDSSFSEKLPEEDQLIERQHVGLNSPQLAEVSVQQRPDFSTKTEATHISMEGKNEIIGISSGPSLQTKTKNSLDSDNEDRDNEELFEFSDSAESPTVSSRMFDSYNNLQQSQEPSDKQKMEGMSSSSSYISEDESTHYTVNSDQYSDQGGNYDSSSSSDSEKETRGHVKKQEEHKTHMSRPPYKESQTISRDSGYQWPTLNLEQTTKIRRRLDIKTPSLSLDSSFSNESGDEAKSHITKQEQEVLHMSRPPIKVSQTVKQENQWPTVDLGGVTRFKRRLDVKAPSVSSDSSSSNDSEDETLCYMKKQEQDEVHMTRPPSKVSQTVTNVPENQWPSVDLEQKIRVNRRLDIKAPSQSSDSSSSNISGDETKSHIKKQEQEVLHMTRPPIKVSQTVKQENQWPTVDLGRVTQFKRRLDVKAPSMSSNSSCSSDSENENKKHIKYEEDNDELLSVPLTKTSEVMLEEPGNQWPIVDLGQRTQIKRRIDIKVSLPSSDLSSSSDSEYKSMGYMKKQGRDEMHMTRPPNKVSQTVTKVPENQWPSVGLEQKIRIKRRLDFKAPTQSSHSISSSNSEDETTDHLKKQEQAEVHMSNHSNELPQTGIIEQGNQWPILDLGKLTRVKRRIDIKAPSQSSDSSSNKDRGEEAKGHVMKQEQEKVLISRPPNKVSQTVTKLSENQWPSVDLVQVTQIKRHLAFKGPPSFDLSSSSESENEKTGHIQKEGQEEVYISRHPGKVSQTIAKVPENQWPTVDLGQIRIKRRLDIKAPKPISDSFAGSDSEDEITGHIQKKYHEEVHISQPPVKISQTVTKEPYSQWPTVDFGRLPQIKRRLDIKGPSQGLDSSSSRDSENETKALILKQKQDEVQITNPPIKVSQTMTKVPEKQWPVVDIEQITQIKRRLDFKGPSPSSGSSSNSHYKDDTKGYIKEQKEEEVHMSRSPIKVSTTVIKVPENYWPTVGLEQIKIKRRLDIKAPSQSSDSSSSNERDEGTKKHSKIQEQEVLQMSRPSIKLSQTTTNVPENQWPTVDLGQVTQIKRRLDFKGPSESCVSPSSTHTEYETKGSTQTLEQEEVHMSRPPIKASQTLTKVPENQWPTVGLGQIKIKRRLDIKAPSSISNSTSSSDREDETKIHLHGQDQVREHMALHPIKVSQTLTKVPEKQWPTLDLEQITQIKRRLDFKGPSASSGSSSSSHSKDETKGYIKEQKEEEVHISRSPIKVPTTVTKVLENHWPTVGLEQIKIKRRLDIKAPSQSSDSSSIDKSDDETKSYLKNQEQEVLQISRPPIKLSQTMTKVPENQWPTVDLGQVTQIKRRLDFKGISQHSGSFSSSHTEDEIKGSTQRLEQEEVHMPRPPIKASQTLTKVPEKQWPTLDLEQITQIKRRLDFKGPSPSSSSSSHSKDETKGYIKKQKEEQVHMSMAPIKLSQTVTKVPETHWPTIGLEQIKIRRRLDIKAPTPGSDSSFTSDNEDETKTHMKTQEKEDIHKPISTTKVSPTVIKVPETQWPTVDFGQVTQIKRRLDFKGLSPDSGSSFSSTREHKTTDHTEKWVQEKVHILQPLDEVAQTVTRDPNSQWPTVDFGQLTQIKRRLDFKAPTQSSDSSSSSEQGVGTTMSSIKASQSVTKVSENQWPVVDLEDVTQIKRRLDFKAPPPWSPSSRRETEDENKDLQAHVKMDYSAISTTSENNVKSSDVPVINLFHTPRKDHNIKLEKYSVIPDHLENKPTNDTTDVTPDINPELQTRWATMNLGISRFRKRLEITPSTTEPPSLSSPYSEQYSNTEARPGGRPRLRRKIVGMQEKDSSPVFENKTQNDSITLKDPYDKYTSLGNNEPSVTEEQKTELDTTLSGFGSQHIKRYENIWVGEKASTTASQQQPYTFSGSDSETVNTSVPHLSIGVPHIKRRLDIKAPSLESSNASSFINKSEKDVMEYSKVQSRQISTVLETADDSLITYKRSIIKESSPLSWNYFPPRDSSQTLDYKFVTQQVEDDRNASLVPRTGRSASFDHIVKSKIRQSRSNTDVDLLDEIRWTGIGHHLSDLSEPSVNAITVTQPQSPPRDISSGVIHKMQDNGKSNVTPMNKYLSLDTKGVSPSSSDSLNMFGISPLRTNETTKTESEDRQKRGLGALKAMSLERRLWETDNVKDPSAPSDGLQDDTQFDYGLSKRDTNVLPKEPLKHIPSASTEKRKDADLLLLLYGVPRYKAHGVKDPLQEAPPPLPETPPPDD